MKTCSSCKHPKPLSQFNRHSTKPDGLQTMCKGCNKKSSRAHYERNKTARMKESAIFKAELRAFMIEYKSKLTCSRCPQNHPATLDFHHHDPKEKEFTPSQAHSIKKFLLEVTKCEVLCSNCHRIHHWNERQWLGPPARRRSGSPGLKGQ